jgi:large subunit ribosomal protein L15
MVKLHELRPAPGSVKKRKRVGRGHSAGQGKTSGRGTKGQNARSGGGKGPYFEGGQLPLVRRLPFARGVGFTNIWRVEHAPVNLERIAQHYEPNQEVSPQTLAALGIVKSDTLAVAVLGDGDVDKPLHVKAHRISKTAQQKIIDAGGTVEVLPKPEISRRRY